MPVGPIPGLISTPQANTVFDLADSIQSALDAYKADIQGTMNVNNAVLFPIEDEAGIHDIPYNQGGLEPAECKQTFDVYADSTVGTLETVVADLKAAANALAGESNAASGCATAAARVLMRKILDLADGIIGIQLKDLEDFRAHHIAQTGGQDPSTDLDAFISWVETHAKDIIRVMYGLPTSAVLYSAYITASEEAMVRIREREKDE